MVRFITPLARSDEKFFSKERILNDLVKFMVDDLGDGEEINPDLPLKEVLERSAYGQQIGYNASALEFLRHVSGTYGLRESYLKRCAREVLSMTLRGFASDIYDITEGSW